MKFWTNLRNAMIEAGLMSASASDAETLDVAKDAIAKSTSKKAEVTDEPINEPTLVTEQEEDNSPTVTDDVVVVDDATENQAQSEIVKELAALKTQLKTQSATIAQLEKQVKSHDAKIKQLEEEPADTHSAGKGAVSTVVEASGSDSSSWKGSAQYIKAQKAYELSQKKKVVLNK